MIVDAWLDASDFTASFVLTLVLIVVRSVYVVSEV